ncbi:MAG: Gfo/Idh/MocA family protein [Christensenellales bacterium]|jgi:predicted dehydrogenase
MPAIKPIKVGLIGSGAISYTYLQNMTQNFHILDVVGCSDIVPEKSARRAEQFNIRQMTNEEIFNDPEIQIVVNTTYPISHYEVTRQALEAGKHVHTEKMLAENFEDGKKLYDLAKAKGLRLSCAPDTFLGGAIQTALKLIKDGYIGKVITGQALILRGYKNQGPYEFGPNRPGGMYAHGSAIPYDMGGYYSHALLALLGPVKRLSGFGVKVPQPFMNVAHPRYGEVYIPEQPTTMTTALEFESGVIGNLTVSGEIYGETPRVEIYGTDGCLIVPDPNNYSGPLLFSRSGSNKFMEIPLTHWYNPGNRVDRSAEVAAARAAGDRAELEKLAWQDSRRGIGVADLAYAITNNRPHRCSAEMGLSAMEIIYGTEKSCEEGIVYNMTTKMVQPKPLRAGFVGGAAEGVLDD